MRGEYRTPRSYLTGTRAMYVTVVSAEERHNIFLPGGVHFLTDVCEVTPDSYSTSPAEGGGRRGAGMVFQIIASAVTAGIH